MPGTNSRTTRVLFVGSLIGIMLAVIATSMWRLLVPLWSVYHAGHRDIPWQDYSSDRLAELLSERRNILLIGYATWNLSSSLPLHLLETHRMRRAIAARDMVPLRVDFTNQSAETAALLEFYGLAEHEFLFAVIISGDARDKAVVLSDWSELNDSRAFEAITKTVATTKPSWE